MGVVHANNNTPFLFLDVKTINPSAKSYATHAAKTQGQAANMRYDQTLTHYGRLFSDIDGVLLPFVVEKGGFIHPKSLRPLRSFIKRCYTSIRTEDGNQVPVVDYPAYNTTPP